MKKLFFFGATVAIAALALSSCKNTSAKVEDKTDSISYAAAVMYSEGLLDYQYQVGLDSTCVKEFIKGIKDGAQEKSEKDKAYFMGLQIGDQIATRIFPMMNEQIIGGDSTDVVNQDVFFDAFFKSMQGEIMDMTPEQAQQFIRACQEAVNEKAMLEKYGENKAAGIAWLENNKTAEGVQVTESGLQYKIISLGTGEKPTAESTVKCNYRGTLIDGTEFDSSYKRNEPAKFSLGSVISGWTEGFQLMPEGTKFELYIPYQLGYKSQDRGTIKPFSTLIFEIEFISIEK